MAVEHPNVYDEMGKFPDWFDYSEYLPDHSLFNEKNRSIVGKLKEKVNGAWMIRFINVRQKQYCFE